MALSSKKRRIFLAVLHGIILFFALWWINNTSYSSSVDEALLKRIFIIEDLILPKKYDLPKDIVFINVSKDIQQIADPTDYGYISITDRGKLGRFFDILAENNNQHRFVLCDLFFEYPSLDDSLLAAQLNRCKKVLFPYHFKENIRQNAIIKVPSALADYQTYNGKFSKFKLIYKDSLKTVPLVLYEHLEKGSYLSNYDLRSISPRYYIRPYHLESKKYPYFNLGELLMVSRLSKSFYKDYLQNKFIVIGNFENDQHDTPIGNVYGPLILLNTYLSLKQGRANVSWDWILFMVVCLSITSYILLYVKVKPPEVKLSPWIDFIIHHFLNKVFSFLGICSLIAFLSELFFSITLSISPLFFYLVYMNWCITYYDDHIKRSLK